MLKGADVFIKAFEILSEAIETFIKGVHTFNRGFDIIGVAFDVFNRGVYVTGKEFENIGKGEIIVSPLTKSSTFAIRSKPFPPS